jgi:hypothetical protein
MLMKILISALFAVLMASCSKMSINSIVDRLPDRYLLTESETNVVAQRLHEFLGWKTPPTSLVLKSPDGSLVCGIANGNRFFVGSLSHVSGRASFQVRHVVNTDDTFSTYETDVKKLCRF